ncbi:MAG: amino acid ABC transporter substrate-binding protein [Bacillota bacterium]|nr:amino acid ABC transporter substrate-binding protein [Bacillota bacterium]
MRPCRAVAVLATVLVVLVAAAGCSKGAQEAQPQKVVIGMPLSFTGSTAKEGQMCKEGVELWKDYVNDRGGINIGGKKYLVEIKYYDDESKPETSARLTEKLITEDNIKLLFAPYGSPAGFAASTVAEKYKVPMIMGAGGATNIFTRGYKYIFGVYAASSDYFKATVDLLVTMEPRPKTVAILTKNDVFSLEAAEGAKKFCQDKGLQIVYYDVFPVGTKDLTPQITAIKQKNPDVFLGSSHLAESIIMMRNCKELDFCPQMIAMTVGPPVPDFAKTLGKDAEYVLGCAMWVPTARYKDPVFGDTQTYVKLFKEKWGHDPSYHAAGTTTAAELLQMGLEKAGSTDPEKVREALSQLGEVELLWGRFRHAPNGMVEGKEVATIQILNGQPVPVWPKDVAAETFKYPLPPWSQR